MKKEINLLSGMNGKVFFFVTLTWLASLFQGITIALPAWGIQYILDNFSNDRIDIFTILIFFIATISTSITIFISKAVSAYSDAKHFNSILKFLLEFTSRSGRFKINPDEVHSNIMNKGMSIVEVWRSVPSNIITIISAIFTALLLIEGATYWMLMVISIGSLASILISKYFANISSKIWQSSMDHLSSFASSIRSRFVRDFTDVLLTANTFDWANQIVLNKSKKYFKNSNKQAIVSGYILLFPATMNALIALCIVIIAQNSDSEFNVSSLAAIIAFINLINAPISTLGDTFESINTAKISARTMNEYFQPEILKPPNSVDLKSLTENPEVQILGDSGAGKSTIIRSFIDKYSTDTEKSIGYCPQNSCFIESTLLENIILGKNIEREYVEKILHELNILGSLNERGGLDLIIQSDASNLSGGEARRIAFCRALVQAKEYLILDEPTAGVNKSTIDQMRKVLYDYCNAKTIIETSHIEPLLLNPRQVNL